ncbi:hypothetical protein Tco_0471768 [Tanacetum coccineum]
MTWFEQLEIHLHDLYLNNSSYAIDAFKLAFRTFFGEEHQTFKLKMFHNLDQLRLQLERENLHEVNAKTCLEVLRTQFKEFFASKGVNSSDHLNQCWQQDFKEYTLCEPDTYRRDLLENLDTLKVVIHRAVITYGILRMKENEFNALKVNGKQLNEEILHEHEIKKSFKLPLQDVQINLVQAVDDSLIVSKSSWIESENNNALSKSVNETQLQQHESLVTERTTLEANLNMDVKALDDGSVITESSRTKSDKHDTSSRSGNYITHAVDADIRPVNDQVPFAKIMPPRMRTRSTGRPAAESLGGGTGERVDKSGRGRRPREGNDECVDELNGQGNDQGLGANGGNLLPAMLAQVSNRGNLGNQNGNVVNENEYDGKGGAVVLTHWIKKMKFVHDIRGCSIDQKVKYTAGSFVGLAMLRILIGSNGAKVYTKDVQISDALTDEAVRNGSIKKIEKRGNMGEPCKDRSVRDDIRGLGL